jgi:hypothetical protein
VEQNRKPKARKAGPAVSLPKEENEINQNIADVINDWISESRETRRAEKSFSDEKIATWKSVSLG